MIPDCVIAPVLFTASITAAALIYAAGNLATSKLISIKNETECLLNGIKIDSKVKNNELLSELLEKEKEEIAADLNSVTSTVVPVILFLITNMLVIAFWITNLEIALDIAVFLYVLGVLFMIVFIINSFTKKQYPTKDGIISKLQSILLRRWFGVLTEKVSEIKKSTEKISELERMRQVEIKKLERMNSEEGKKELRERLEKMTPEERQNEFNMTVEMLERGKSKK